MDSTTGTPVNHCDGVLAEVSAALVLILRGMVEAYPRGVIDQPF